MCHCSSNCQGRHGGRQPEQALLGLTDLNVPPRAMKYEWCSGGVTKNQRNLCGSGCFLNSNASRIAYNIVFLIEIFAKTPFLINSIFSES